MFRVAVAVVAVVVLGALAVVAADWVPWSSDPEPVRVTDLDVPDAGEPRPVVTASPSASTPASVSTPEVIAPPTVSPEDDHDDAGEGEANDDE